MSEKLFPITIDPNLCRRCQKCSYSCPPKAIFWKDSMRYVDYNKCDGCLRCVDACEHGANTVISIEEGTLEGFEIDETRCNLCQQCTNDDFCFQNRYSFDKEHKKIIFNGKNLEKCFNCLKCFKSCPNNAIIPIISEKK